MNEIQQHIGLIANTIHRYLMQEEQLSVSIAQIQADLGPDLYRSAVKLNYHFFLADSSIKSIMEQIEMCRNSALSEMEKMEMIIDEMQRLSEDIFLKLEVCIETIKQQKEADELVNEWIVDLTNTLFLIREEIATGKETYALSNIDAFYQDKKLEIYDKYFEQGRQLEDLLQRVLNQFYRLGRMHAKNHTKLDEKLRLLSTFENA
jgi:hypothetical protein